MSQPRLLHVRTTPDARTDSIEERLADHYDVSVRVPAQDGQANRSVCELLARHFSVPVDNVIIIRGSKAPKKIIALYGV